MHPISNLFYRAGDERHWHGRVDGDAQAHRRWHQHMKPLDLSESTTGLSGRPIALLGFACDEGVIRNKGRAGAAEGPATLRQALCNLPVVNPDQAIYDAGDVHCPDGDLESAQRYLAWAVTRLLHLGAFPVLLGGGHEIAYGHYCGVRDFLSGKPNNRLGVVNFDAHFDNRQPQASGATSGTGFWQIEKACRQHEERFLYYALGIQKMSNTQQLFETALLSGTRYALAEHFDAYCPVAPSHLVQAFAAQVDSVYLTIDLDVFAAPYAPGVSAPAYLGIMPDARFFDCLEGLVDGGKIVSMDIAEFNPAFDIDGRTARLAASLIFRVAERLAGKRA